MGIQKDPSTAGPAARRAQDDKQAKDSRSVSRPTENDNRRREDDASADRQLLARLKAGDAKAVQAWFATYHDKLLHLLASRVSIDKDREELVQDTFLACLKHLPLFRGESSIWTWMVRIAQHEVADYYRKRYAKKFIHALPLSELLPFNDLADAQEISHNVRHVLAQLAHDEREILLMKYVDRKKVKQIAAEMGRTVKSVESVLFRARGEFRRRYGSGDDAVLAEEE